MILFCRNFLFRVQFLKNHIGAYMYFVLFQEMSTIRPCVYVYTLHSDEVVSLLISGCEIVV